MATATEDVFGVVLLAVNSLGMGYAFVLGIVGLVMHSYSVLCTIGIVFRYLEWKLVGCSHCQELG